MVNIAKPPSDGSPLPPFPLQVPAMCLCRELIQLLLFGWLVELGGLFVCFFRVVCFDFCCCSLFACFGWGSFALVFHSGEFLEEFFRSVS